MCTSSDIVCWRKRIYHIRSCDNFFFRLVPHLSPPDYDNTAGHIETGQEPNKIPNVSFLKSCLFLDHVIISFSDLYPDLSPADYDNTAGHIETGQEPVTAPNDVSEEQKQEWKEELDKVSPLAKVVEDLLWDPEFASSIHVHAIGVKNDTGDCLVLSILRPTRTCLSCL